MDNDGKLSFKEFENFLVNTDIAKQMTLDNDFF